MNLIGSRATLTANICALILATIMIVVGAYIVHERLGYYMPQDAPVFLFPALVMFVVRNRYYSFFFLALYIALAIDMFAQARSIYLGAYLPPPEKWGPVGLLPPFFMLSVFCLVMYALGVAIRLLRSRLGLDEPKSRLPP